MRNSFFEEDIGMLQPQHLRKIPAVKDDCKRTVVFKAYFHISTENACFNFWYAFAA